ncbi:FAD-dependent oxidoreductase [Nonomuraea sp. NPDC048882]|uniref:FAD-dependent oxidoreductase n=1 Tax=unclassified Nonomuraea TaxID=2593643 RepID=UPI0033EF44BF
MTSDRVVVVGAGVSGLTTAVVLAEAGHNVHVITAELPGVTSLAAGAMWGPYLVEPSLQPPSSTAQDCRLARSPTILVCVPSADSRWW